MRILRAVMCIALLLGAALPAAAQAPVTAAEIDRLDAAAAEIDRQIRPLERTDPTLAGQSMKTLAELRDEVIYLRVKLRRESVSRAEGADGRSDVGVDAAGGDGDGRAAADAAELADVAGGAAVRGDDDAGHDAGDSGGGAGRIAGARIRQLGASGGPARSDGEPHAVVRR